MWKDIVTVFAIICITVGFLGMHHSNIKRIEFLENRVVQNVNDLRQDVEELQSGTNDRMTVALVDEKGVTTQVKNPVYIQFVKTMDGYILSSAHHEGME